MSERRPCPCGCQMGSQLAALLRQAAEMLEMQERDANAARLPGDRTPTGLPHEPTLLRMVEND